MHLQSSKCLSKTLKTSLTTTCNQSSQRSTSHEWAHNLLEDRREIAQRQANRTHKYANNAWSEMHSPSNPCSLFHTKYHDINKQYGIITPLSYSNMYVVLTYLISTYVFDSLQPLVIISLSTFLVSSFLVSSTLPLCKTSKTFNPILLLNV
jgi:hypothetical protein